MSSGLDWIHAEERIAAQLARQELPGGREQLLAELQAYAAAVVAEARRLGEIAPTPAELARQRDWLYRPVFICGHHRSGTTLLHELLDGHPQLVVLPSEATYFTSFNPVARPHPGHADLDAFVLEWLARFADPNFEPHFRLGRSDTLRQPPLEFARCFLGQYAALRDDAPHGFAALLALVAAYAAVVPAAEPRRWVEKTPLNETRVHRLCEFGQARFIHLVRDPRDALGSLRQAFANAGRSREFDTAEHAWGLGRSLRLARRHARDLAGRYLVVRYEDLASQPSGEMERVRDFLGIDPHASLATPTAGGISVRPNTSFESGEPGVVRAPRARVPLAEPDRRLVEALAGQPARHFGYESAESGRFLSTLRAIAQLPRLGVRRLGARLAGRIRRG